MKLKIGISGIGGFAHAFIPLFMDHPLVGEVVLAEIIPERLAEAAARYGIKRTFPSHEALCESDVDAVVIITQRHLHGPQTLQALKAGKHVYAAVPMGASVEEARQIIDMVAESRLVYMSGETSYYYPNVIYCRERFQKGEMGHFVYGEGNYLHDMSHGFYDAFKHSGGADWQRVAGFPPMYYATHSISMVLSVTGSRATHVSCMGYADREDDDIFGAGKNLWDNPYSNQTALFRTSDGGMMRINEFRRVGWKGSVSELPMGIYGTLGSYEEVSGGQFWADIEKNIQDVGDLLRFPKEPGYNPTGRVVTGVEALGRYARVQDFRRLPQEFWGNKNGHLGSHQFLVDDFVKSVATGKLPPLNAWEAAKYSVPGLIAHESALQGGVLLEVPDFGNPPEDWARLDPYEKI